MLVGVSSGEGVISKVGLAVGIGVAVSVGIGLSELSGVANLGMGAPPLHEAAITAVNNKAAPFLRTNFIGLIGECSLSMFSS